MNKPRLHPSAPADLCDRRIQIPAYTVRWRMDDKYGEIIKITEARVPIKGERPLIAHVRLDKSGDTVRVLLADCT